MSSCQKGMTARGEYLDAPYYPRCQDRVIAPGEFPEAAYHSRPNAGSGACSGQGCLRRWLSARSADDRSSMAFSFEFCPLAVTTKRNVGDH